MFMQRSRSALSRRRVPLARQALRALSSSSRRTPNHRPSILVTQPIWESGIERMRKEIPGATVNVIDPKPKLTDDQLIEKLRGVDAVVTMLTDPISAKVIEKSSIQLVSQYAVGLDNIDLECAKKHNVSVCHTPGVLTDATADLAFALLLGAARQLVAGDKYVRDKKLWRFETLTFLGPQLSGKTLGIYGMGRIGQAVAQRGRGFGMDVVYHNRSKLDREIEELYDARYVSKEELLRSSDFLSLHCPLNAESKYAITKAEMKTMKKSSILVNTSRGPTVNEADLAAALRDGDIAAAGLDVYEKEPAIDPLLLTLDNVVLAPHVGSATVEARSKMSDMVADSVIAFYSGQQTLPNQAV